MNLGDDDPERSATAGEYVLGTLAEDDRRRFEQELLADPVLQAEVYAWQDRLLGLGHRVPAVAPQPLLWPRIEARLARAGAETASIDLPALPIPRVATASTSAASVSATGPSTAGGAPQDAARVPPLRLAEPARAAANDPLWRRLRRWQAASAVAVAAVLVLSTLLLLRVPLGGTTDRYLALLQAPDHSTGWVVEAEPGGTVRLVPIALAAAVPPGKALQFWTKPEGAAGPTSLGLVHPGEAVALAASRLPALGARQLFELTLEPEGGSPIGRPTGPVLYVGRTVRL